MDYDVLIAGAGPGGLTTALVLSQRGYRCLVVEKARRANLFADVGGGYHIGSTTLALLDWLGIGEQSRQAGVRFEALRIDSSSGRQIKKLIIPGHHDLVTLRRSTLQALLLGALGEKDLVCDEALESFEESFEGVRATLTSGRQVSGRLLVGADGVWSRVREQLFADGLPRFCGLTSCWGRVEAEAVNLPGLEAGHAYAQLGPGAAFASATLGGEVLWSVFWRTKTFERTGRPLERVKERLTSWAPPIQQVLERSDPSLVAETGIWDRGPSPLWHRSRVALIGDAAHPMTPFLGQGANSAMLDGFVLAHSLDREPQRFSTYQKRRGSVTNRNVRVARLMSQVTTATAPWSQLVGLLLGLVPPPLMLHIMLQGDALNDVSDLLRTQS